PRSMRWSVTRDNPAAWAAVVALTPSALRRTRMARPSAASFALFAFPVGGGLAGMFLILAIPEEMYRMRIISARRHRHRNIPCTACVRACWRRESDKFALGPLNETTPAGKRPRRPLPPGDPMRRLVLALVALSLPAGADTFPVVETTIADIEAAYQSGTATPQDVVQAYLKRISQFDRTDSPQPINGGQGNQPLNAYMRVNPHALRDANKLDPNAGGPLFGIPIIVKDNTATLDMPTTAGSVALGGSKPQNDATLVRKLRAAGAIILGKGTLTEFANF